MDGGDLEDQGLARFKSGPLDERRGSNGGGFLDCYPVDKSV